MKVSKYTAQERFHTKIDWLDAWHHFSFGGHYDKNRTNFGALLVVNDDVIEAHNGFGTHPHRDMEIITIPLSGTLTHEDSTGGRGEIGLGQIQVMTAGTGVRHSEYNHGGEPVHSYQLWIIPEERGLAPSYTDSSYNTDKEGFITVVSKELPDTTHIHQDAYISVGFLKDTKAEYKVPTYIKENHGIFITTMDGGVDIKINGDAYELSQGDSLEIDFIPREINASSKDEGSRVLVIQVPL